MFSFFRKGKGGKPPPSSPASDDLLHTSERPLDAPTRPGTEHAAAGGGIQVQEVDVRLPEEIEEAVMLYASGRSDAAAATLRRYLVDHPENRDPLPWRMLLDIYEVSEQRQPFEDLAVDFAVRFERSPPTWNPVRTFHAVGGVTTHPSFAFAEAFSPQDKARWQHFLEEGKTAADLVLDFSQTPVPGQDHHARAIQECIAEVIRLAKDVRVVGGDAFLVRLNAHRSGDSLSEAGWLLLLAVLQLLGRAGEYEAVALEFAVHFEISPPAYISPKKPAAPVTIAEDLFLPSSVFPISGVIGPGTTNLFADLQHFAADLPRVEIDLTRVGRIDFAVSGLLLETLVALQRAGKQVVFREGNELVNLMLQLLGAGQYATILPRTRR